MQIVDGIRDPLDPWLTGSAAAIATLGIASTLIAAFASTWFNRVVLNPGFKNVNGQIYTSRSFTLRQLANGAHDPGRFSDAETLLVIGSIILTIAAVTALIARSHLSARGGVCVAMVIGTLLIGWGFELAKTPITSISLDLHGVLWESGDIWAGATPGAGACQTAVVLSLLGATFAALAWRRASWFEKRWGIELTHEGSDTTSLTSQSEELVS